jgi:hypothetical protein
MLGFKRLALLTNASRGLNNLLASEVSTAC